MDGDISKKPLSGPLIHPENDAENIRNLLIHKSKSTKPSLKYSNDGFIIGKNVPKLLC